MGEFNVNKSDGSLEQTAGMPDTYPASQVTYGNGSVEDALDELNESVDEIESNWVAVALPFTPRKTGILLCTMRINTQGRAFIVLNGTTPTIVDGYNINQGYITSIVGVTKNVQVSQSGSENVQSVSFSYKAL